MGAWGVKLYQNDLAEDIKYEYTEYLREGKTNEEATKELILKYEGMLEDIDDGPNFWFVLADQQWKIGRLLPYVKEQALNWIEKGGDLHIWYESSEKLGNERKRVLEELSQRLNSPQPPEKKIYKHRYYICPWKDGDIFALPLNEYGKEYGLNGKYIMIQQASQIEFNKNIIPLVRCWISDNLTYTPERENCTECIHWGWKLPPGRNCKYIFELDITSKRIIPKDLVYVGNFKIYVPKDDDGYNPDHCSLLLWKKLKSVLVECHVLFND